MRAEDYIKKLNMEGHVENGLFIECHYPHEGNERAASGSIYYYVAPGEKTEFHRIDCDEYWCFNGGHAIELWVIGLDGKLSVKKLGMEEDAEPMVRFAAGEIFASRLDEGAADGCLVTCITVPRFTYDGFELMDKETMLRSYPEIENFYK